jgi:hypothetical protein
MSVLHINNITNKEGTGGPTIAGITTVDSTGFMRVPVGDTRTRLVNDYENIVTDGLVLHLDAGRVESYGGDGTTWRDLSGNGNNGTLVNGVGFTADEGGSLIFDGVNDYVNIGIGKGVNQFSGDFAVSAWVFRNAGGPTFGNVIGDYYTGSVATTNEWQLMMSSTAQFNFYRVGSGYVIPNTASGYSASQWINVVVSRIGSTISMYANNNLIASTTNSEVFGTATGNLNIGIDSDNASEKLCANISNVMIYKNKGLTATEVSQNYNALVGRYS